MYDLAEEALERARKVKKDFSGIYTAEGDLLMSKGSVGEASAKYEMAIRFNPGDKTAYLKYARIYKNINPSLALENLEKLIAIDPEYVPAYAELGDLYYRGIDAKPNYNKAIEAYEKIMNIPGVPLAQETRYGQLLFFTDRNADAVAQISKVLAKDPTNYVMKRVQAYNNFKLEDYDKGLEQMTAFMKETKPEDLIAQDYIYFGRYLMKAKQPELAVENLKKGYEMDTVRFELLKEIADAYQSMGNYAESVGYSEKFLDSSPDPAALDYFNLGRTCYSAVRQMIIAIDSTASSEKLLNDSIQRDKYLEIGEKAFSTVAERLPESYMGYFWMGNIATLRDIIHHQGTAGLAKEYYEKALPILSESNQDGKRNREIIEIYAYMATYYFVKEDSKTSQEYWQKILEIDPENARAKQVMDEFKKAEKK
jgi:tetratricopeptide (TPR) repeat protein